ncbi:hypothetical protein GCM10009801_44880 [Streptomyces albiaxialis]|uniref:Uncharacterized protein n=1 Tax=Streptomyces albiaxialis TaxID=329523 RepID=A0ABN2W8R7_9ACTN
MGPLTSDADLGKAVLGLEDLSGEWTEKDGESHSYSRKDITAGKFIGFANCYGMYTQLSAVGSPVGIVEREYRTDAHEARVSVYSYANAGTAAAGLDALRKLAGTCDRKGADVDVIEKQPDVDKYHVVYDKSGARKLGDERFGLIGQRKITESDVDHNIGQKMYGAQRFIRVGPNIAVVSVWQRETMAERADAVERTESVAGLQADKLTG